MSAVCLCGPGRCLTLWLRQVCDTLGRGSGSWATPAPVPLRHSEALVSGLATSHL